MSKSSPADPWDVARIEAKAPDVKSVKAARKVLAKGHIGKVEPRADGQGWWAVCQGLTGTYDVSVRRGPRGGLESRCTCPSPKRPCKHALALLIYLAEHPKARPEPVGPAAPAARDLESLLRAAFGTPDDDTPRLALADYLEENGEAERAALIRVQCQLVRLPVEDSARKPLKAQETQALRKVRRVTGKLPQFFRGEFVRGFLRLTDGHAKTPGADGLPTSCVQLFRDGWVESLRLAVILKGLIPLYRLVGDLDLTGAVVTATELRALVKELRLGDPETRTLAVRVSPSHRQRYEKLVGVTSARPD